MRLCGLPGVCFILWILIQCHFSLKSFQLWISGDLGIVRRVPSTILVSVHVHVCICVYTCVCNMCMCVSCVCLCIHVHTYMPICVLYACVCCMYDAFLSCSLLSGLKLLQDGLV